MPFSRGQFRLLWERADGAGQNDGVAYPVCLTFVDASCGSSAVQQGAKRWSRGYDLASDHWRLDIHPTFTRGIITHFTREEAECEERG